MVYMQMGSLKARVICSGVHLARFLAVFAGRCEATWSFRACFFVGFLSFSVVRGFHGVPSHFRSLCRFTVAAATVGMRRVVDLLVHG